MAQPELLPAIDLIVFDDANPHAVMFQLHNLVRYLGRLERELGRLPGDAGDDALRASHARLRAFDLRCLEQRESEACAQCGNCAELADLLDAIVSDATTLSDRLAMRYFTHVGDVSRQTMAL